MVAILSPAPPSPLPAAFAHPPFSVMSRSVSTSDTEKFTNDGSQWKQVLPHPILQLLSSVSSSFLKQQNSYLILGPIRSFFPAVKLSAPPDNAKSTPSLCSIHEYSSLLVFCRLHVRREDATTSNRSSLDFQIKARFDIILLGEKKESQQLKKKKQW